MGCAAVPASQMGQPIASDVAAALINLGQNQSIPTSPRKQLRACCLPGLSVGAEPQGFPSGVPFPLWGADSPSRSRFALGGGMALAALADP